MLLSLVILCDAVGAGQLAFTGNPDLIYRGQNLIYDLRT